jgi:hypothetical protein
MATVLQGISYQCDQCGAADVVAVPLVYQQGTRAYSGILHWGVSQTHSAQAATPPRPRRYSGPLILWSFPILIFFAWVYAGFSAIHEHPKTAAITGSAIDLFLLLGFVCLGGLILNLRKIARYNREVYPQLYWEWEHTYLCRRCGRLSQIPS